MKYKVYLISLFFLINPIFSFSQTIPFGGKILMTMPCTCSGGWYISFFDNGTKVTTPIVFQYGVSRLNSNYNMYTSGVSILGSYVTGGTCLIYAGTSCISIPVFGMITPFPGPGMGTSLQ